MASKLPQPQGVRQITDLDASDNQNTFEDHPRKPHRHRKKTDSSKCEHIKSYSGNFPSNRSKSVEWVNLAARDEKHSSGDVKYFKSMLQTKDAQIEKLVQRITDLHIYNNQFAQDNERLQTEIQTLTAKLDAMTKSCQKLREERHALNSELEAQNAALMEECETRESEAKMMKTLVYRLNVQIEWYQDRLRKLGEREDHHESNSDHFGKTVEWGSVHAHTLAPLLNAYEQMLKEKDELVRQHEIEMNRFTGKLKEVLEENDRLQSEMDDVRAGNDGSREERTRLQAQLDVCRSKAEVQTKRADMAKEKLVEVMRCYEQKVQAQALDLERLQDAYSRTKAELVSLKSINSQPEVFAESIKECQKLFAELKSQHELEKTRISSDMTETRKLNSELTSKVEKLSAENAKLQDENHRQLELFESLKEKTLSVRKVADKLKESRDRLKARLKLALEWAQKLESSQQKVQGTWDELKQLEAIVKHKEAQIRGLHARHLEEVDTLQKRLLQREETIKTILKERTKVATASSLQWK